LLSFFNQMVFVQPRIAILDIYSLTFGLLGTAQGFRKQRPHVAFDLAGLDIGLSTASKCSRAFPFAVCIAITAAVRLMQGKCAR